MDNIIIFTAKYLIYISVSIFLLFLLLVIRSGHKNVVLKLLVASLIAVLLAKIVSTIYFDPRPFMVSEAQPLIPHSPENGFPSSHTLASMLMGFILWEYNHKIAILLIVLASFIGIARVFADVHHIQDIIGATVIALLSVLLANVIVNRITYR